MTDNFLGRRLLKIGGLVLLVEGILGLLKPQRRTLLWHVGPELAKAVSEEVADNPRTARTVNLTKAAVGLVLAVISR